MNAAVDADEKRNFFLEIQRIKYKVIFYRLNTKTGINNTQI